MLAWLTKLLESEDIPIGTVVHIGAGVGNELALYHDLKCESVLAIEADSTLFKKLQAKGKRFDNVFVQQAWVADTAAERNACFFSNPRFNSLLPADKLLLKYFPNLKSTKQVKVNTLSFNELVTNNVKRKNEKLNVLVLNIRGFETTLFDKSPGATLQLFDWIVVRASDESLFEGGAHTSDIKESLMGRGFELRFSERDHLPFVEQYYQLNTSVIELNTVKSRLQSSNNSSAQTQKLDEATSVLAQNKAIAKQLEEKLAKSLEQFALAKKTNEELRENTSKEIENYKRTEQEQNQQVKSLSTKVNELTAQLNENRKWSESLNEQLQESRRQFSERQISCDLALKLQTKAQLDLDDLRKKYEDKHHNEQKLVELIKELRQKLQQASEFYFHLQENYPNLAELEYSDQGVNVDGIVDSKAKKNNPAKRSSRLTGRKRASSKS